MTRYKTDKSKYNDTLQNPSNDNTNERYMACDLEPSSSAAVAFVEQLCFFLKSLNLFRYKIRVEGVAAIHSIVGDLFATAEKGRAAYGYRPMATGSFTNSHVGHASFKRAAEALAAAGMMEVVLGKQYGSDGPGKRGTATRFRATAGLHEMALGYGVTATAWAFHFRRRPRLSRIPNPLILRSSSVMYKGRKLPGKSIPFVRTPKIVAMAEQINDINAFLGDVDELVDVGSSG